MLLKALANSSSENDEAKNAPLCFLYCRVKSNAANAPNFCPNTSSNVTLRQCEMPKVQKAAAGGWSSQSSTISSVSSWKLAEKQGREAVSTLHAVNVTKARIRDNRGLVPRGQMFF